MIIENSIISRAYKKFLIKSNSIFLIKEEVPSKDNNNLSIIIEKEIHKYLNIFFFDFFIKNIYIFFIFRKTISSKQKKIKNY